MEFRNEAHFRHSRVRNKMVEKVPPRTSNDIHHSSNNDQSPPTIFRDSGDRDDARACARRSDLHRDPRTRENICQVFEAGRCPNQKLTPDSPGSCCDSRSSRIINRKHCNASVEYRSQGSHSTYCNPCKLGDEGHIGVNQFGVAQLGWQSPCSTGAKDRMELDKQHYSQVEDDHPGKSICYQNEDSSTLHQSWHDGMNWESRSTSKINSGCRPSTAPANLYNPCSQLPGQHRFHGSSRSSSPRSSGSTNSDLNCDGLIQSEYTTYPSHCPEAYRQARLSFTRIHDNRHRLGPESSRSDISLSRSQSPSRRDTQRRQGPAAEGWGHNSRMVNKPHPHNYRRLSLSPPPCSEDRTHHPAPDHRRLFHRCFVGGYRGHSPTARPQIFSPKRSFRGKIPWAAPDPTSNCTADGDLHFRPSRGDIIIVQTNQRGRLPNRCRPKQHQGCVRSYIGDDDDFIFHNGDLVVRIGSYISKQFAQISYLPYGILELYKKHDGVWKFLGDAHTEEDLGEKRRNTCIEIQHTGSIRVGENCPVEPNYGDFVIYQDRIKCGHEELTSRSPVIEWWTPDLLEELSMVYPNHMILFRPYVRNHSFLRDRESWLGKRVTRVNRARQGKVEEGIVVMVWPESLIQDGGVALEVLGPDRVGVRVRNWRRKGTVIWPLLDTFLACEDQPLSTFQSTEEQKRFRAAPWGSIEMYIHSREPPAGWVYWGTSQHTL